MYVRFFKSMVNADSNLLPMLQKYIFKLFAMYFLLFVDDTFRLKKYGFYDSCYFY